MKDFLRRNEQPVVAALMFAVWSGGYFSSAYFAGGGESHSLAVSLDRAIPFVAPFVWIYLTVYMMFVIPFLLIRDPRFFRLCALSYLSVIAVTIAAFVIYPVRYERPPVFVDSLHTWAVSLVYAFDAPVNCFPSMHASVAMMAALIMLEVSTPVGVLALLHTILIGASTLFIKQHYILDILGGFALAVVMYSLFFRQRIMDVLAKNVAQLESAIEAILNDRIDARIRRVLEQSLADLVARNVRERLEERARAEGEKAEVAGPRVETKR